MTNRLVSSHEVPPENNPNVKRLIDVMTDMTPIAARKRRLLPSKLASRIS